MHIVVTVLHVAICVFLILVVLLQVGKGMGLSGLMGGGMDSVLGVSSGNTLMKKITVGFAIAFIVTSIMLTFTSQLPDRSIMEGYQAPQAPPPVQQPAPVEAQK